MITMLQHFKRFRPSLKHLLYGGLGGGISIVGAMFVVGLYVVGAVIHPKKRTVFDEYTFSPYEFDLPGETVTFPPRQGDYQVSGWFVPCEGATTTILICPGHRSRKSDLLGMIRHLWKLGHNVLAFDFYGHGTNTGQHITLGYREINDFYGAIEYAKERAPQTRLGVVAYSMGAAVAIMCSAHTSEIEALVLDSAFASNRSVVDYNLHRAFPVPSTPFVWAADSLMGWLAGYHFNQVEPLRDISYISPRPILIIHGEKDSIVNPKDATLLYEAAGEPKELWLLPNVDHCGSYFADRAAYVQRVTAFFDKNLKKPRLQLVENVSDEGEQEGGLSAAS